MGKREGWSLWVIVADQLVVLDEVEEDVSDAETPLVWLSNSKGEIDAVVRVHQVAELFEHLLVEADERLLDFSFVSSRYECFQVVPENDAQVFLVEWK